MTKSVIDAAASKGRLSPARRGRSPVMGIRLPSDLKQAFSRIADAHDTTISALTREIVEGFVKTYIHAPIASNSKDGNGK